MRIIIAILLVTTAAYPTRNEGVDPISQTEAISQIIDFLNLKISPTIVFPLEDFAKWLVDEIHKRVRCYAA